MPVWNFFQRQLHIRSRTKAYTTTEEIFLLALRQLRNDIIPHDATSRDTLILHILCEAESQVFAIPLQPMHKRFCHLWYNFLIQHDIYPPDIQLDDEHLLLARNLVLAFSQNAPGAPRLGKQILGLVDELFQIGNLAMCEVLLELFEASPHIDRTNERNIFFDRYTRRLFDRRRKPLLKRELQTLNAISEEEDSHQKRASILTWLTDTANIQFLLRTESPALQEAYQALTTSQREAVQKTLSCECSYTRLRVMSHFDDLEQTSAQIVDRINQRGAFNIVQRTLQAAYFITLSSGRHEADSLLFDTDPWFEKTTDLKTATLLSSIHKRIRRNNNRIDQAFHHVMQESLSDKPRAMNIQTEHIASMLQALPDFIPLTDFQEVPEGLYDLEQFIGLLAMEQPIRWRLRLCRIV